MPRRRREGHDRADDMGANEKEWWARIGLTPAGRTPTPHERRRNSNRERNPTLATPPQLPGTKIAHPSLTLKSIVQILDRSPFLARFRLHPIHRRTPQLTAQR